MPSPRVETYQTKYAETLAMTPIITVIENFTCPDRVFPVA